MPGTLDMAAPGAILKGKSFEVSVDVSGAPGLARVSIVLTRHGNGSLDELKLGERIVLTTLSGIASAPFDNLSGDPPHVTIVATASCLDDPFQDYFFEPATKSVAVL